VLDKAAAIQSLYQTRFASSEAYRNKIWCILCRSFFSKYIPKTAEIIDIGSGWGEFSNNIEVNKKYAMDLNPASKAHLSPDIVFINQDCSAKWPFASDTFDIVFTSNFIEHLIDKPSIERTVAEAYRCLRNGGLIICICHNITSVSARLLKDRSPIIDIEHTYLYGPETITSIFVASGFKVRTVGPMVNTYTLRYLLRLLPVPLSPRKILNALQSYGAIAQIRLTVPLGNLFLIAQR